MGRISETDGFYAGSERVVNKPEDSATGAGRDDSETEDCDEADEEMQGVDCRAKVKNIEMDDQFCVMRMMLVAKRDEDEATRDEEQVLGGGGTEI